MTDKEPSKAELQERPFEVRAKACKKHREKAVVARFRGVVRNWGDSAGQPEKIVVQPKTRTFVMGGGENPQVLTPGKYAFKKKFEKGPSKVTDIADQLVLLCTVLDLPIVCRVALPDQYMLGTEPVWGNALLALSLRTQDNIIGGAQLEMSLVCENPVLLMKAFGEATVKKMGQGENGVVQLEEPEDNKRTIWQRLWGWVTGSNHEKVLLVKDIPPITMDDLYDLINLELANGIRSSVHRFTGKQLYEDMENRTEVERDVQNYMKQTLETFGMKLERVSAFQFLSPDYDELLEKRGKVAVAAQGVQDHRTELETKDEVRKLNVEDHKKGVTDESQAKRHDIEEARQTAAVEHVLNAEKQSHKLELERTSKTHALEMEAREQQQKTEAMKGKLGALIDLQNQAADAATDRFLKLAEVLKSADPAMVPYLLMAQNPQLANALASIQGGQKQADAERKFREEVTRVYGQHGEQVHKLLLEGIKQVGRVAAAKAGEDHKRLVIQPIEPGGNVAAARTGEDYNKGLPPVNEGPKADSADEQSGRSGT